MRVIAGEARRLKLIAPRGLDTRPTGDKIKETLFNILQPYLYDSVFLDLFAGSGAIGIEALSRGAKSATFIEKDKEALKCIRANLENTHMTEKSEVLGMDVISFLHTLNTREKFDIVFMDPPYRQGLEKTVLSVLSSSDIIKDDAMIICECASETDLSFATGLGFDITRVKDYKNSKHVFLANKQEDI